MSARLLVILNAFAAGMNFQGGIVAGIEGRIVSAVFALILFLASITLAGLMAHYHTRERRANER